MLCCNLKRHEKDILIIEAIERMLRIYNENLMTFHCHVEEVDKITLFNFTLGLKRAKEHIQKIMQDGTCELTKISHQRLEKNMRMIKNLMFEFDLISNFN
jgi:predicted RNA-binding protein Jag